MPNVVGLELAVGTQALLSAGVIDPVLIGYFLPWPITVKWASGTGRGFDIITAQVPAAGNTVAVNVPMTLTTAQASVGVVYP